MDNASAFSGEECNLHRGKASLHGARRNLKFIAKWAFLTALRSGLQMCSLTRTPAPTSSRATWISFSPRNAQSLSYRAVSLCHGYTGYKPHSASSGVKHWGIHEYVDRPPVDDVDWTTYGGCASEASGTVWLVLGIFNNGVSRRCLDDCHRQRAAFERATARRCGRFRL